MLGALVTRKVSVAHLDACENSFPLACSKLVPIAFPTDNVRVEGPEMTKVWKSSLIWQMLLLALQILALHLPVEAVMTSK